MTSSRRKFVKRIGAGTLTALMAGVILGLPPGGGSAAGAPAPPAAECATEAAVFNNPHDDAEADKIHEQLGCLIDGAPAGSEIRVASYHFAHRAIKDRLIAAYDRGVEVKILLDKATEEDNSTENEPDREYEYFDEVSTAFNDEDRPDSWIDACAGEGPEAGKSRDRACIGSVKMHNKFATFSETLGIENVSFLTSSNFQDADIAENSGTDMWNSGYTATDPELYDHLKDYFFDLGGHNEARPGEDPTNPSYYEDTAPPKEFGKYTVFHSPREQGNTALEVLSKVDCDNEGSGGGNPGNRTIVRIANWQFSGDAKDAPGTAIAKKLWDLDNEGCDIHIVATDIADDPNGPLRTLLAKPVPTDGVDHRGPEVREFYNDNLYGLHEKNIMINGKYDQKSDQKVTFTGSYNFTYRSVHTNDETMLRIDDPAIHDSFLQNFSDVRDAAHLCWQTSEPEGCGGGRSPQDPSDELDCHETADEYADSGNVYLYSGDHCAGANGAKDGVGTDHDYGDDAEQVRGYDNKADAIVNTSGKTIQFYNYPNFNEGHPEGDSFCVRPGQWVNDLELYGDGGGSDTSWRSSTSSHRVADDPATSCGRWFGGYHEPHRTTH